MLFFFFFQAEDGIRDRSPSRGLGDVYKRQKIDYKMVMTATNASWDVLHVYFEAQREKMMYEMAQRDRKRF